MATGRRLRLESTAARVKERNSGVREIAELTIAQIADVLGGWCRMGTFMRHGEIGQNWHRQNGR